MTANETSVPSLGAATFASPLRTTRHARIAFVADGARVRRLIELPEAAATDLPDSFEKAGPREKLFFDPRRTVVGIVSAGGLCPGINDVVRAAVLELKHAYGVPRVLGFRYGFAGLDPATMREPIDLTLDVVRDVHRRDGSLLGTSRGPHELEAMLATLARNEVGALLAIGGDGTMRAAHALAGAACARGTPLAVVGIPKTIDDDIPFVDETFGFETAVCVARTAIAAAHAEARSVENGIGLVKLMGRRAGFIAAQATLANGDVNACLVPEVPFATDALLDWLDRRLEARGHAVIVVAEGCVAATGVDASGNPRYGTTSDVGPLLRDRILAFFAERRRAVTLKYIDPSYMLRGARATSEDAAFCDALARNAAHAAMAGKTDVLVGRCNGRFTHVPLGLVTSHRKTIDPEGALWAEVLEATGQPPFEERCARTAGVRAS